MQTNNLNVNYGGQFYAGFSFSELPLAAAQMVAAGQIDQAADGARLAVVGDPLRVLEHGRAAAEAKAFAAADYSGDMPPYVKAWADAAGLEPKEAADSIISESNAWEGALLDIRTIRLKGKQDALKASSHAVAENIADAAIHAVRACIVGVGNAT